LSLFISLLTIDDSSGGYCRDDLYDYLGTLGTLQRPPVHPSCIKTVPNGWARLPQ